MFALVVSVTLTLLPASALFSRVTSSLKLEFCFLRSINLGRTFSCVLKFEHVMLVRSYDVLETVYAGSLPSLSNIPSKWHKTVFLYLVGIS